MINDLRRTDNVNNPVSRDVAVIGSHAYVQQLDISWALLSEHVLDSLGYDRHHGTAREIIDSRQIFGRALKANDRHLRFW
jgi:hypothetical protein